MDNSTIKELLPVLKKTHLVEATRQYSDYVTDIGGKPFEEFLQNDYMSDKSLENVIVKSELADSPETLEDVLAVYLGDYAVVTSDCKDDHLIEAEMSQETFDQAVEGFVIGINKFINDNY